MLTCFYCKFTIQDEEGVTYIPFDPNPVDENQPIEYLHYPRCSKKYFAEEIETHIIRGEN
jgi:hypothetical protein